MRGSMKRNKITFDRYVPEVHDSDKPEMVDHPTHYRSNSGFEVIDVIEAWELDFSLGNAVKYIARAGIKHHDRDEDLEKAQWYLQKAIDGYDRSKDSNQKVCQ